MTSTDDLVRDLSARLIGIACDADDISEALATEPLHPGHLVLLSAPVHQLAVALRSLEERLWLLEYYGENPGACGERLAA